MKKIYIIRHGQTDWNLEGRTQGIKDSNLTQKGIMDARLLSKTFKKLDIHSVYSSTLNRARATSEIVAEELGLPIYYNNGLVELNYGFWEGLTIEEIRRRDPEELEKWFTTAHLAVIPNGEKLKIAQERIVAVFNKIVNDNKEENILIVSHGTMIKLLLLHVLGMPLSGYNRLKQDNCAINTIGIRNNQQILLQYNDICHLNKGE